MIWKSRIQSGNVEYNEAKEFLEYLDRNFSIWFSVSSDDRKQDFFDFLHLIILRRIIRSLVNNLSTKGFGLLKVQNGLKENLVIDIQVTYKETTFCLHSILPKTAKQALIPISE